MGPHLLLIENFAVLDYYEHLSKQNLKPQLAIYYNQRLIIYCKLPTSRMEKITHFFSHVISDLLIFLGYLSLDQQKILDAVHEVKKFRDAKGTQRIQELQNQNNQLKKALDQRGFTQEEMRRQVEFLRRFEEQ